MVSQLFDPTVEKTWFLTSSVESDVGRISYDESYTISKC
jgi:hypothetical protein